MKHADLILAAKKVAKTRRLSDLAVAGEVGSALLTHDGNVYVGVSIHAACGIGFCAEHAAIANMITNGESRIRRIVAVSADGRVLPPCGRCRELMLQVSPTNTETELFLDEERVAKLKALLPERWQDRL